MLDEFALILHLDDVYWSEEGRISVEMVSLCVVCLGLVLVGASPFDFGEDDGTLSVGARDRRRRAPPSRSMCSASS